MKKLLLTLALAAAATFADAQGTIVFANNAGTRFSINGVRPASASVGGPAAGTYTFAVFAGLTADSLSNEPVGDLGWNSATGGLITSPNPQAHQLPGFAPDSTAFIQIRGWESRFGADWQAGFAGLWVMTDIKPFVLGPASGAGTVIWSAIDPTKLHVINMVPEPSTIALALFGLGSLLLFRRHKRF